MRTLVLASSSAARLRLLRGAGFDPLVVPSGIDESAIVEDNPRALVLALAVRKAQTVAGRVARSDGLVVGCDSMLLFHGRAFGRPGGAEQAAERWRAIRGRRGTLLTGHCVVDLPTGRQASGVGEAEVLFATPDDAEIAAYVASGEPTSVAGGFTIDGFGAPFVERIDGDHGNVIGLSLPLLRRLLADLGVRITDLWRPGGPGRC